MILSIAINKPVSLRPIVLIRKKQFSLYNYTIWIDPHRIILYAIHNLFNIYYDTTRFEGESVTITVPIDKRLLFTSRSF